MNKLEKAVITLNDAGYDTDNLWNISQITNKYNCTKESAARILNAALGHEPVIDRIWDAIEFYKDDFIEFEKAGKGGGKGG